MHSGDLIADRFELLAIAGEGGMGAVWRAHDRLENTLVALKVMLRAGGEEALRFAREASVMRQLSHPRIVRHVADGATPEGAPWIAMEWLEGEDLTATLARGPMAAGDALAVCIAVADALGAAHAKGLVHRDLKPANVYLVDGDPLQVKLLDFGVVRRLELGGSMGRTRVGAMIGTPGYMSPEQARGDAHLDARADVFELGCVLFECLTGRAVFSGEHLMALLAKVLLEEAPRLAALVGAPAELDDLVARMLSKEAADRPADAAEVARAMRALRSVALTPVSAGAARGPALSPVSMSREQVWLCALVVDASPVSRDDATLLSETAAQEPLAVSQAAETSGARLVGLAGGAQILLWEGVGQKNYKL
jgi:serine/threonine protein kinase